MMNFVCLNGKILPAAEPLLTIQNRGYKWGDGVFETMKVHKGKILLADLHFERLFLSLQLLQIDSSMQKENLTERILQLCGKNNCTELARIRLAVFRVEGRQAGYTIEALPLTPDLMKWSMEGIRLTIYPLARKSGDAFANLKSANFLPYVMASLYAMQNSCDDALVLNSGNAIADSSRANLFLVKNDELVTPALHQGCVNGVMRRFIIDGCKKLGMVVRQEIVTEDDLLEADEAFLTNAIQGIRWVKQFRDRHYISEKTKFIYQQLLAPIYT